MSTRTDATYDATTTSPRTDSTTDDFSTHPVQDPHETKEGREQTGDAPTPHGDTSWTEQCKRQFSTTSATRMQNLNDDANQAMHDGV